MKIMAKYMRLNFVYSGNFLAQAEVDQFRNTSSHYGNQSI